MKKVLLMLMCMTLICGCIMTTAFCEEPEPSTEPKYMDTTGDFTYLYKNDGTITILEYRNANKQFVYIPSELSGSVVNEIGDSIFVQLETRDNIKRIRVPETVTFIGETAFADCPNLEAIYGVKGSYAETYAAEHNIPFVDHGPEPTVVPDYDWAPKIEYTLSETGGTWNPVTVSLDITDDEEIVDVRYVRMTNSWWGMSPPYDDGIDSGSVSYDVDCKKLFYGGENQTTDEFLASIEEAFGGVEHGIIALSYYYSASGGEINDRSIPVTGDTFTIYQNGPYIIYAEDKSGNKTFKFFEVNNIKLASADVDLNIYSDFSGEYIAEMRLNNIIENPNAGIKNIYVYRDFFLFDSIGAFDGLEATQANIESYKRNNQMLEPKDGVYYLRDPGEYKIIFEDEWGNFSYDRFWLNPGGNSDNEIKCSVSGSSPLFTAEVKTLADNIAKIEYADCSEWYGRLSGGLRNEDLFVLGTDRKIIEGRKFYAEANKAYAVRATFTDGTAAYDAFLTPICIEPQESYRVSINGDSGIISLMDGDTPVDTLYAKPGETVTYKIYDSPPGNSYYSYSFSPDVEYTEDDYPFYDGKGYARYGRFTMPMSDVVITASTEHVVPVIITGNDGDGLPGVKIVDGDNLVDSLHFCRPGDTVTLIEREFAGIDVMFKISPDVELIPGESGQNTTGRYEFYQYYTFTVPDTLSVEINVSYIGVYPHIYEAYTEKGNTIANLMCIWSGVIIGVKYDEKGALVEMKTVELPHMGPSYETVTIENFEADKVFAWDSIEGMKPIGDAVKVEKK